MPTSPLLKSIESVLPSSTPVVEQTFESSPFASLQETNETSIDSSSSQTDWASIRWMEETKAPIPYDLNDEDEPYDPNDGAAVRAFWMQGVREGRVTRGVGKDAVVLKPEDFGWYAEPPTALPKG